MKPWPKICSIVMCAAMGSIALVTASVYADVVPLTHIRLPEKAPAFYAGVEQTDARLLYVGGGSSGGRLAIDNHAAFQVARPYEHVGINQVAPGINLALNWNNCGTFKWSFGRFGADGPHNEYPVFVESLDGSPALTFDGGDKLRMIPEGNAPLPSTLTDDVLTVELWARHPDPKAYEVLVRFEDTSDFDIIVGDFAGGVVDFDIWHHLVAVSSGGTTTYYRDGVQLGAPQNGSISLTSSTIINLGARSFKGSIAAVRIHTEAMTPADIAHNFNGGVMLGTYMFYPIIETDLATMKYGDPTLFPDRDWRESEHFRSVWIPSEDPSLGELVEDDIPYRTENILLPNGERYYDYTTALGLHQPIVSAHEELRGDGRKYKIVHAHHWSFAHSGGTDMRVGLSSGLGFPGIFNDHESTHGIHGMQMGDGGGLWTEGDCNYTPEFGNVPHVIPWGPIAAASHVYISSPHQYYHNLLFWEHLAENPEYGPLYMGRMYNVPGNNYPPAHLRDNDLNPATPFDDEWLYYAARNVTWDYPRHNDGLGVVSTFNKAYYMDQNQEWAKREYWILLQEVPYLPAGWYEPPKWRAPQQHGYNNCVLEVPAGGGTVTAELRGFIDADRGSFWRAMFVATEMDGANRVPRYGEMFSTDVPTNSFVVKATDVALNLVVSATPTDIRRIHFWGNDAPDDANYRGSAQARFPYQVKLVNTAPLTSAYVQTNSFGSDRAHPNGGGFVAGTAWVEDDAWVGPNAKVLGHAHVNSHSRIEDNAVVSGYADIIGRITFGQETIIRGDALVTDWAYVDKTVIEGNARVLEHANIPYQTPYVKQGAICKGNSFVGGGVSGTAIIDGIYNKGGKDKGYYFNASGADVNPGESDQEFELLYLEYRFETQTAYRVYDTYGATWGRLLDGTNGAGDGSTKGPLYVSDNGGSSTGAYALAFDGTNDFVDLHKSVALKDEFSFEIDVKWAGGANDQRLLSFSSSTTGDEAWLSPSNSSGKLAFAITIGGTTHIVEATNALPTNVWHQIRVMSFGDRMLLHLDGSEVASSTNFINDLQDVQANACYIGRGPATNSFAGSIDNFVVWSKSLVENVPPTPNPAEFALPPTLIGGTLAVMQSVVSVDSSFPVEYYFDETTGNPGGTDSGWQTNAVYYDDDLEFNTLYTYVVRVRDGVSNTTADSASSDITTPRFEPAHYIQDEDGWLTFEAEYYDNKVIGTLSMFDDVEWAFDETVPDFSGIGSMKTSDRGQAINEAFAPDGVARLDFLVKFNRAGPHRMSIRGHGTGGSSDSCHAGIDMQEVDGGLIFNNFRRDIGGGASQFDWKGGDPWHEFNVPSAGLHWINIWMREDGAYVDKILIFPPTYYDEAEDPKDPDDPGESDRPMFITATVEMGGFMSPVGNVAVTRGTNQTFTITEAVGFAIQDVLVDGVSVGTNASYTFPNVQNHHTIAVSMMSTGPRPMPFADGFDAFDGYALGDDLNGKAPLAHADNPWIATGVVVTNNPTQAGGQSAALTSESAWMAQVFTEGETNVVTEMWIAPVFAIKHSSVLDVPADASYAFYVNLDGQVVAYSNQTAVVLGAPGDVTNGVLTQFKVVTDHNARTWDMHLHGAPLATGLGFAGISPNASYGRSWVRGAASSAAVVDSVKIIANVDDSVPPTVVTYSPANGTTNVVESTDLVLTFNELIRRGTGNITITNLTDSTQTAVISVTDGTQVSVVGSNVTINPAANLVTQKDYAIWIDAGVVQDWSDNPFGGIADNTTWAFTTGGADGNAPNPDAMTWASVPAALSSRSITMTATTATDANLVEYFFTCTSGGGNNSSWQASPTYIDTGLLPDSTYNYTVQARDTSVAQNMTAASASAAATTPLDPTYIPFYEPFTDRNLGSLDGQFGWESLDVAVQDAVFDTGPRAGTLSSVRANAVTTFGGGETNVWTDMMLRPVFSETPLQPDSDDSVSFHVSTNGHVMVYDGTNVVETLAVVTEGVWTRFSVYSDHIAQTWDLYVDGVPVGAGLGFYSSSHSSYAQLSISGAGEWWTPSTNAAYVDEIRVGLTNAFVIVTNNPPVIASYSPADDSINVERAVDLVLTFYLPVTNGAGNITIKNLTDVSELVISVTDTSQVSIVGKVMTINPAANLSWEKDYAVWIDGGAIEALYGIPFAGIADDTTWSFTTVAPDGTPPTPDPMIWAPPPSALSGSAITMTSATASDLNGVEYYFTCTSGGGNDSGWQASSTYIDTGLTHASTYIYTVKARDLSEFQNETDPSIIAAATTLFDTSALPFYEPFDARTVGPLDGQYDWKTLFVPSDVTVQSAVRYSGPLAGRVSAGSASARHTFTDGRTDVWTEMMLQPVFAAAPLTPAADASVAFYVATNGHVMVYDGTVLTETAAEVTEGEWTKFTVHSDHASKTWDLIVGTNDDYVVSGLHFYARDYRGYTELKISGAGDASYGWTTNAAYVDEIRIAFTNTVIIADTTVPTIVTYSPADDSTTASATNDLVLTFSEPIQIIPGGNITIKNLTDATERVIPIADVSQVTVVGSNLTINPWADLLWGAKHYAVRIDASNIVDLVNNAFAGIADDTTWDFTTDSPFHAPNPDPMVWASGGIPYGSSTSAITMTAGTALHWSGVEYYFTCTVGGGHNRNWNASPLYTDTGLTPGSNYTYTVTARGVVGQIETAPSAAVEATPWRNPSMIPFYEPFESRTLGPLDGQYGWVASDVTVQSAVVNAGFRAGELSAGAANAVQTFGNGHTNVWTDMMLQPISSADQMTPDTDASVAFYVATNGHVMVYDGAVLTETSAEVTEGEWTRFTFYSDHIAQTWDLYVDRVPVATGLGFYSSSRSSYGQLAIRAAEAFLPPTKFAYVDQISVGVTIPIVVIESEVKSVILFRFR